MFISGSFSGVDETACFSDSIPRLRLIAPGLHEREKQARTRPYFWSLTPQCNRKKLALGCIVVAFSRHPYIAHCSVLIYAVSSPPLKLPGSYLLGVFLNYVLQARINNAGQLFNFSDLLGQSWFYNGTYNFWNICRGNSENFKNDVTQLFHFPKKLFINFTNFVNF